MSCMAFAATAGGSVVSDFDNLSITPLPTTSISPLFSVNCLQLGCFRLRFLRLMQQTNRRVSLIGCIPCGDFPFPGVHSHHVMLCVYDEKRTISSVILLRYVHVAAVKKQ